MKHITLGIMAHVDSGKTTLSEGILYETGSIRDIGRVDHQDTFLDTEELEKQRGITIFSKQAQFPLGENQVTLIDTPGHVDFSEETERVLQVLDYAVLLINGAEGIQTHTVTLWKLLKEYQIPVFIFVNKMDQVAGEKTNLLKEIHTRFGDNCVDFSEENKDINEEIATCSEPLLNQFLSGEKYSDEELADAILQRFMFPVYFGSALKMEGIDRFVLGMKKYFVWRKYPSQFGARIYKVTRDKKNVRMTHMKITGGSIKVKDVIQGENSRDHSIWNEKIDEIRIYSGDSYTTVNEALAGTICLVTGLTQTYAGEGLGFEVGENTMTIEPVLSYIVEVPEDVDKHDMLQAFRVLEEESPHLHVDFNEETKEIGIRVMGEIELEILQNRILNRTGVVVKFALGRLLYKETIASATEGIGHFEPLRHYAEVHLLLEPGEPGSGLEFFTNCSVDDLSENWQRLVLTHLEEKVYKGVLTGSPITDMKITLVAGRASNKHTEGGDFRQATYRAVRHGLKNADSILLEPYYSFRIELPMEYMGRAMTDVKQRFGSMDAPEIAEDMAILKGQAPVATFRDYYRELISYTGNRGKLFLQSGGYFPCHNSEEVIASIGYDSEADVENPTSSVFCAHGAGFVVPWYEVREYMHLEGLSLEDEKRSNQDEKLSIKTITPKEIQYDPAELEEIFKRTYGEHKKQTQQGRRVITAPIKSEKSVKKPRVQDQYLLVDGYNIIFSWPELRELANLSLDAARGSLMDTLCNYQGFTKKQVILVFDAYRVKGHHREIEVYQNISVVYTKTAETADRYIERTAHEIGNIHDVTVATSDGMIQIIVMGTGTKRLSASDLKEEIERASQAMRELIEPMPGIPQKGHGDGSFVLLQKKNGEKK